MDKTFILNIDFFFSFRLAFFSFRLAGEKGERKGKRIKKSFLCFIESYKSFLKRTFFCFLLCVFLFANEKIPFLVIPRRARALKSVFCMMIEIRRDLLACDIF